MKRHWQLGLILISLTSLVFALTACNTTAKEDVRVLDDAALMYEGGNQLNRHADLTTAADYSQADLEKREMSRSDVELDAERSAEYKLASNDEETEIIAEEADPDIAFDEDSDFKSSSNEDIEVEGQSSFWLDYQNLPENPEASYVLIDPSGERIVLRSPDEAFDAFLDHAPVPVYACFDASWRKDYDEICEQFCTLAKDYENDAMLVLVDADTISKDMLNRYLVRDLPQFIVFNEGKIMAQVQGYYRSFASALEQTLDMVLESTAR